jgi:nucleoside-diphosphate-sugar epimerase
MRRILINGNMGYIGPVVVSHFRKNYPEVEIIGFDTGFFAGCLVDPNIFPESNVDVQYFGDIRSFPSCILKDIDSVIQLAAISNDPMGKSFEIPTKEINYESAVEVAKLSKKMGVKNFVFASSCSVYGAAGVEAKHENSDLNPQTAYAKSKIDCEKSLSELADDSFVITALRFATACGFSPRLRLDLVLNDFVASGFLNHKIEILSDGTPLRPLIHVKDMARAMEWASFRNFRNGGNFLVVNAGSNEWNFQIKELAQKVRDILGNIELSINTSAPSDTRSYKVDFSLFSELAPEFTPKISLDEAVKDLLEGLKEMSLHVTNFRNSHFIRLKTLTALIEQNKLDNYLNWNKN